MSKKYSRSESSRRRDPRCTKIPAAKSAARSSVPPLSLQEKVRANGTAKPTDVRDQEQLQHVVQALKARRFVIERGPFRVGRRWFIRLARRGDEPEGRLELARRTVVGVVQAGTAVSIIPIHGWRFVGIRFVQQGDALDVTGSPSHIPPERTEGSHVSEPPSRVALKVAKGKKLSEQERAHDRARALSKLSNPSEHGFLTAREVSAVAHISLSTVYELPELERIRIGRKVLYTVESVLHLITATPIRQE